MDVGRPPIFSTVEDMQAAIDEYFNSGLRKRKIIVGKGENAREVEIEMPTITGLCYYIGFESRQSFYDYEKYPEFSYTVKRARLFIEREYEEQLTAGNTVGAIFALKNMGWKDKTEIENYGKDGGPIHSKHVVEFHDFSDGSPAEDQPTL